MSEVRELAIFDSLQQEEMALSAQIADLNLKKEYYSSRHRENLTSDEMEEWRQLEQQSKSLEQQLAEVKKRLAELK